MIIIPGLKNKKAAVFGLGATGAATAAALCASGADVYSWDDSTAARDQAANTRYTPQHPDKWPWAELQFLVLSPGVPLTHPKPHPIVEKARKAGVRILGDLELFAQAINALPTQERPKVIAITGSNGKSTTTALVTHILTETGFRASSGGNIGHPLLAMPAFSPDHIYVLELSSFQLDLAQSLRADIAVLLNITADHLERHGSMAGYLKAKQRIFYNQTMDDTAIVGVDDPHSQGVCAVLSGRRLVNVVPVSAKGALGHGVYALNGRLFYHLGDKSSEAGCIKAAAALQGAHNWQNASAALAAAISVGATPTVAVKAMERFAGLPHRLELVARFGQVSFVNDSKATNVAATARALEALNNVYLIAGGVAKKGGVEALRPLLSKVRGVYLIGASMQALEEQLKGHAPTVRSGNLAAAVSAAFKDASALGDAATVLLSPACASYDQFSNFMERGDVFRRLVKDAVAAESEDSAVGEATPANGASANGAAA